MNIEKDDGILLATIEDKMKRCRQKDIPAFTNFLDMRQVALAQAHFRNTEIILTGGYEDAERQIALFLPDWLMIVNDPTEISDGDPVHASVWNSDQADNSDSDQFCDERLEQQGNSDSDQFCNEKLYKTSNRNSAQFSNEKPYKTSNRNSAQSSNEKLYKASDSYSDKSCKNYPVQSRSRQPAQGSVHEAAIKNYLNSEDSPLCILRVSTGTHHEQSRTLTHHEQSHVLTHRDYLGALTGLGVDRSICGDILVRSDGADLIILSSMADYLLQNYVQAGRTALSGKILPLAEMRQSETKTALKHDTIASPRLDCCIASAFNMSRSKAQDAICTGLVAVNSLLTDKTDHIIEEGDKITLRGQGKAKLISIGAPTRKQRIPITWEKYI